MLVLPLCVNSKRLAGGQGVVLFVVSPWQCYWLKLACMQWNLAARTAYCDGGDSWERLHTGCPHQRMPCVQVGLWVLMLLEINACSTTDKPPDECPQMGFAPRAGTEVLSNMAVGSVHCGQPY